jgi:hypothetical protein
MTGKKGIDHIAEALIRDKKMACKASSEACLDVMLAVPNHDRSIGVDWPYRHEIEDHARLRLTAGTVLSIRRPDSVGQMRAISKRVYAGTDASEVIAHMRMHCQYIGLIGDDENQKTCLIDPQYRFANAFYPLEAGDIADITEIDVQDAVAIEKHGSTPHGLAFAHITVLHLCAPSSILVLKLSDWLRPA